MLQADKKELARIQEWVNRDLNAIFKPDDVMLIELHIMGLLTQ